MQQACHFSQSGRLSFDNKSHEQISNADVAAANGLIEDPTQIGLQYISHNNEQPNAL